MSRPDDHHLNGTPAKPKDGGASAARYRGNGTVSQNVSRAEKAFVGALLAVATVTVAATVLHANGVWFSNRAAQFVYPVLWTALWLPGTGMFLALSLRKGRASLLAGLTFQVTATVLYWASRGMLGPAGALGLLGLSLPFIVRPRGETRRQKATTLAFFIALLVIVYHDPLESWPAGALCVAMLWVPYAGAIWPSVGEAVDEAFRQEAELAKRSRAYRWFDKATTLTIILGVAGLAVLAVIYALSLWFRYGG